MIRFVVLMLAVAACVPAPVPPPQPPDASDAAPSPLADAALAQAEAAPSPPTPIPAPPAPQTPCQAACSALAALGCREGKADNCVPTLSHMDGTRSSRRPGGKPVTCVGIAGAHTVAEARAQLPDGPSCVP